MATTYEELIQKFDKESNKLTSICSSISMHASYANLIFNTIDLWYTSRIAMHTIRKVERLSCVKCDGSCGFPQKKKLQQIVNSMKHTINNASKKNIPMFIPMYKNILEDFEDKLEDYWIATDQETKDLMHSLAEKVRQKNANC